MGVVFGQESARRAGWHLPTPSDSGSGSESAEARLTMKEIP